MTTLHRLAGAHDQHLASTTSGPQETSPRWQKFMWLYVLKKKKVPGGERSFSERPARRPNRVETCPMSARSPERRSAWTRSAARKEWIDCRRVPARCPTHREARHARHTVRAHPGRALDAQARFWSSVTQREFAAAVHTALDGSLRVLGFQPARRLLVVAQASWGSCPPRRRTPADCRGPLRDDRAAGSLARSAPVPPLCRDDSVRPRRHGAGCGRRLSIASYSSSSRMRRLARC